MSEEIQDSGLVTEVSDGVVTVELQRGGGCTSCAMRGFCFSKNTPSVFKLKTDLALQAGDKVELEVSASGRVLVSTLIFIVPVLFLIMGFLLANIWITELGSIMFAFAAMALSFFIIRLCDRRWGNRLKIEIARKL
jgi:sigma-E factor negative regulatory protein RseC